MNEFFYLFFALVPAVLWITYFYKSDKSEPEPIRLLLISAFIGGLMVFPAGYLQLFFTKQVAPFFLSVFGVESSIYFSSIYYLIVTLLIVAIVEELLKFLAVRFSAFYSNSFNEYSDGIIYMVAAAFGFAAFENFLYFLNFGHEIIFVRSVFTPLFHASVSAIAGHYLAMYKFNKKYRKHLIYSIIFSILVHFLYNFLVYLSSFADNFLYVVLAVLLLLLSAKWMFDKLKEEEERDEKCWFCELPENKN